MRLELMTYALRKRGTDDGRPQTIDGYDKPDRVVAGMVAVGTADSAYDPVIIPDDLRPLIELWPALSEPIRQAVLAVVGSATESQ